MKQRLEKRVKYLIISMVCALAVTILMNTPVLIHATSATLTFSAESKSVAVGDTFYVVIILDSSDTIGGFEGYVSYDSSMAEFVTGGSYVNGGDGLLRIYDMDSTEADTTKKYSLQFTAKKTGDCTFDTSDAPAVYNADGDELSVSSNTLTVSITNSSSLSSNNNLSKLLVSPGELNQTYTNDVTAYKVEVPYESDMLFISAETEDEDAEVTVEGNEDLEVGSNYVHVVVTAPSGAKKDIQIAVTRLEEEDEEEEVIENVATGVTVSTNEDDKMVLTTTHTYEIAELEDKELIPDGYEESSLTIGSDTITAYLPSDNLEDEFVLLHLTNESGETDFYQYDRIEKTIQRFEQNVSYEDTDDVLSTGNTSTVNPYVILIAAMAGLIIILSIALVVTIMKRKSEKEDRMEL